MLLNSGLEHIFDISAPEFEEIYGIRRDEAGREIGTFMTELRKEAEEHFEA